MKYPAALEEASRILSSRAHEVKLRYGRHSPRSEAEPVTPERGRACRLCWRPTVGLEQR